MFIEDLSTYAYFSDGPQLRAVGWLEAGHRYRQGQVETTVVECIRRHLSDAYQPLICMGIHHCSLCETTTGKAGYLNLFIPTQNLLFIAPELILHYIEDHNYCPPIEFEEALLNCPEQNSPEYMNLLSRFDQALRQGQQEM